MTDQLPGANSARILLSRSLRTRSIERQQKEGDNFGAHSLRYVSNVEFPISLYFLAGLNLNERWTRQIRSEQDEASNQS